jgi:hypothetical protein
MTHDGHDPPLPAARKLTQKAAYEAPSGPDV